MNERVDSLSSQYLFRIFRTKTQTRTTNKKQFTFKVTPAQICLRCMAPRAVLGASRFFLGAPFSSSARFFFARAIFVREQNE